MILLFLRVTVAFLHRRKDIIILFIPMFLLNRLRAKIILNLPPKCVETAVRITSPQS